MLEIVDLDASRRKAFLHGVRKGFAAPLLLFSDFEIKAPQAEIKHQALPKRRKGSIADDWRQVGLDLQSAIEIEQTSP